MEEINQKLHKSIETQEKEITKVSGEKSKLNLDFNAKSKECDNLRANFVIDNQQINDFEKKFKEELFL